MLGPARRRKRVSECRTADKPVIAEGARDRQSGGALDLEDRWHRNGRRWPVLRPALPGSSISVSEQKRGISMRAHRDFGAVDSAPIALLALLATAGSLRLLGPMACHHKMWAVTSPRLSHLAAELRAA